MNNLAKLRIARKAHEAKLVQYKHEELKCRDGIRRFRASPYYNQKYDLTGPAVESDALRKEFHHQRTAVVRPEIRAANLAYGFLRNKSLRAVENSARSRPKWDLVLTYIKRFSGEDARVVHQRFKGWVDVAELPEEVAPIDYVKQVTVVKKDDLTQVR